MNDCLDLNDLETGNIPLIKLQLDGLGLHPRP